MNSLYQHYLLIGLDQYALNFGQQYSLNTLILILPETILLLGLIVLVFNLGTGSNSITKEALLNSTRNASYCVLYVVFITLVCQFGNVFRLNLGAVSTTNYQIFQSTYSINFYTQGLKMLILLILFILYQYLQTALLSKHTINAGELPLLLHITVFLTFIIISCEHYAILLLALEGFSLTLYILTTIDRSYWGIVAAVKYFTFGTLGSILLFWGVAHYYALFPNLLYKSLTIASEYAVLNNWVSIESSYNFASTSILLGLLIKLGAAPIHQWVPDVYSGSLLLITALFATLVKVIIFSLFCFFAAAAQTTTLIVVFGVCSLIVGGFSTLRQTEIKRFLAYSSISHVGFLLIGDLASSYVYLLTYLCSSLLFFSVLLSVRLNNNELIYLADLRLIKKSGLWNTFLLVISLASMAGLPPFSGFFGKFLVWTSLVEDIYLYNNYDSYLFLITSIALTLITIFYYTRLIVYIYVSNDNEPVANVGIGRHNAVQTGLGILVTFWLFFQPKTLTIVTYLNYININTYYAKINPTR